MRKHSGIRRRLPQKCNAPGMGFFARTLARGNHSVAYRMRAEIPGRFSALPTRAFAMYAPELKANSDEIKLTIGE